MRGDNPRVIYWDASAILSALFKDGHSDEAQKWVHQEESIHLMSTLSYTETCAVIARIQRDGLLADVLIKAALEVLERGPWLHLSAWPEWKIIQPLSVKWPLRGADLWHLATAKSTHKQLPELFFLTFDSRLNAAALGQGMLTRKSVG
jgi:predicted nucleic acid-binding protein